MTTRVVSLTQLAELLPTLSSAAIGTQVWFADTKDGITNPDPVGQKGVELTAWIADKLSGKVFVFTGGGVATDTQGATIAEVYAAALREKLSLPKVAIMPQTCHFAASTAGEIHYYKRCQQLLGMDHFAGPFIIVCASSHLKMVQQLAAANMRGDVYIVTYYSGTQDGWYMALCQLLLRVDHSGVVLEIAAHALGSLKQRLSRKAA